MQANCGASTRVGPEPLSSVDVRRLPGIKRLAADYVYAFGALAPFFAGDPSRPRGVGRRRSPARNLIRDAPVNLPRCFALSNSAAARQQPRWRRPNGSADPRTVAVVTGQQAGLFGGPLFTILKALTALKLAEQVTREHGAPAVAVFWIEAEDHDWDEVRSCTVLRRRDDHSHREPPAANGGSAASRRRVARQSDRRRPHRARTDSSPHRVPRALIADLRTAYAPGVGMADAFGRWLERVLGERGLVVYDASDPAAKPLVGDLFSRELSFAGSDRKARGSGGRRPRGPRFSHAGAGAGGGRRAVPHRYARPPTHPGSQRRLHRQRPAGRRGRARAGSRGTAGGVQPERAAAADRPGHDLPHRVLRRGTERARLSRPAARDLCAFRRADAADVLPRDRNTRSTRRRRGSSPSTMSRSNRSHAQDDRR